MDSACEALRRIIYMFSDIGLEVNPPMSEVLSVSCNNFQSVFLAIESALSGVTVTEKIKAFSELRSTSTVAVQKCLRR